jgi:carbamoylphosphate synthase large subunit
MKIFIPGAGLLILHIRNFQEVPEVDKVIISEIYPWRYGNFVADASYLLPRFDHPDFFRSFIKLYDKEKFDVCIPISDVALHVFSEERSQLKSLPFILAINPIETIRIASDKLSTYDFFIKNDIPTARVYSVDSFLSLREYSFPYYIKPRFIYMRGSGKELYAKIEDNFDIEYCLKKIKGSEDKFIIQDYLDGTEINIDFFCDNSGKVQSINPLKRLAMGVSRGITRGEIIFENIFDPHINKMVELLRFWGANNVQAYLDRDRNIRFTEINARFSGSSVLVKEAGVNYFSYFIKLLKGEEVVIIEKVKKLEMMCWEQPFFFEDSKIREVY